MMSCSVAVLPTSRIALVEIVDRVVAGAEVEHKGVVVGPAPKLIITGPAV